MRILLAEDDLLLGEALQAGLELNGFTIDWFQQGRHVWQALLSEHYDAVVLDLGLPELSGREILSRIRSKEWLIPVLILTALDEVDNRIENLDSGADDYLVKPSSLGEIAARLRALIRRSHGRSTPCIHVGALTVNPAARTLSLHNQEVHISPREFSLLLKLIENAGRVISRENLLQTLYGWGQDCDSNTLEVHIHHIRKKIGASLIRTVRGIGYIIDKEKIVDPQAI